MIRLAALGLGLALLAWPTLVQAHGASHEQRLPTIGRAPDFALTSQDGATVALRDFKDRVVAVAFIYTSCPDVCPLLTDKMVQCRTRSGRTSGRGSPSSRSRSTPRTTRPRR